MMQGPRPTRNLTQLRTTNYALTSHTQAQPYLVKSLIKRLLAGVDISVKIVPLKSLFLGRDSEFGVKIVSNRNKVNFLKCNCFPSCKIECCYVIGMTSYSGCKNFFGCCNPPLTGIAKEESALKFIILTVLCVLSQYLHVIQNSALVILVTA